MRILFFYTGHRQLTEISHSARFSKEYRHDFQKADVIYHCNNPAISLATLESLLSHFVNPNKRVIATDKNTGFRLGHIEAISDSYEIILQGNYDWVVHLHPDVYITNEEKFLSTLVEADKNESSTVMFPLFEQDATAYTTDLFAWKPSQVNREVFSDYIHYIGTEVIPEVFIYESLHYHAIPVHSVKRYQGRGWQREIDEVGVWHPHNNKRAKIYLDYSIYLPLGRFQSLIINIKHLAMLIQGKC